MKKITLSAPCSFPGLIRLGARPPMDAEANSLLDQRAIRTLGMVLVLAFCLIGFGNPQGSTERAFKPVDEASLQPIQLLGSEFLSSLRLLQDSSAKARRPDVQKKPSELVLMERRRRRALMSEIFAPVRKLLLEKGLPFEPNLLQEDNWRTTLAPVFAKMRQLQKDAREHGPLSGLYMANRLRLPEHVELSGDTFILVRELVFEGPNTVIHAPGHAIHCYPIEKVQTLTQGPRGSWSFLQSSTVIDTSTTEPPSQPKAPNGGLQNPQAQIPLKASNGVCGNRTSVDGQPGGIGYAGYKGQPGGDGLTGRDADPAGQIYLTIPRGDTRSWILRANGGKGGRGGDGGDGGPGGQGGIGAAGGDGADCPCDQGGSGSGGKGGPGGFGGEGGKAGTGGRGGRGGNGGAITVIIPSDFRGTITAECRAGSGGDGGMSGEPGSGGPGGPPGPGGKKGGGSLCHFTQQPPPAPTDGSIGDPGGSGPNNTDPRKSGDPGPPGNAGSYNEIYDTTEPEGRAYNNCDDFNDNDGDGYVDYDDVDCWVSPIIIDVMGNGYHLTGLSDPVTFDFDANGKPLTMGWTATGEDDAFLVLDRDGDGKITTGRELFGNNTPLPDGSPANNGFIVLAAYDDNSDGYIDASDRIYAKLRLWQDVNHNGISEDGELRSLSSVGVGRIGWEFRESRRQDRYGNVFRYRSKVIFADGSEKFAYDVLLVFAH